MVTGLRLRVSPSSAFSRVYRGARVVPVITGSSTGCIRAGRVVIAGGLLRGPDRTLARGADERYVLRKTERERECVCNALHAVRPCVPSTVDYCRENPGNPELRI